MSKTIWKFPLETTLTQQIEMPDDAEILTIQTQGGKPCIWALVNPSSPIRKVTFEIFGTGHVISDEKRKYVGTYQMHGGDYVFHCFELH